MVAVDELIQRMQGFAFWAICQDLSHNNAIGLVRRNGHSIDVMFRAEGK